MQDAIGWLSSAILLATIVTQIKKQWEAQDAKGVSQWLFIGQAAASAGFALYSFLLRNWVFTVTNSVLVVSAGIGLYVTLRFQRAKRATEPPKVAVARPSSPR